jgi:hypothetical protein
VYALAFAPDGQTLASAGKDGTARLWDLAGGAPVTLAHPDAVLSVAFSPDGAWATTACADGAARLWDAAGGRELRTLAQQSDAAACGTAYLAGGRMLVAAWGRRLSASPGGLRLWSLIGEPVLCQRLTDPLGVWAVAATPQGKTLAWGGGGKRVTVWDVTAQDRFVLQPAKKGILALALTPDGRTLALSDDYAVRLWDVADRQEQTTLPGHKGMVSALAFAPDGRTLASGGWDKRVILWDVAAGRERQSFAWDIGRVLALAFSPDGLLAAAAGDTGRVIVWDVE